MPPIIRVNGLLGTYLILRGLLVSLLCCTLYAHAAPSIPQKTPWEPIPQAPDSLWQVYCRTDTLLDERECTVSSKGTLFRVVVVKSPRFGLAYFLALHATNLHPTRQHMLRIDQHAVHMSTPPDGFIEPAQNRRIIDEMKTGQVLRTRGYIRPQNQVVEETVCVFRAKVATDSGRNLPPIPAEGCH
jgi:hypothetical protein